MTLSLCSAVKFEAMEEQLKILTLKYQLGQETSSRDIKALQQSLETAEKEKNTCQLNRIREKAQDQKFHELESKIMEELRPLQLQLEATVNRALPSSTISCFNQELIHQTRQTCLNLPNELNANLGRFAGQMDQRVSVVAQENGLLQREKEACSLDLQERDRRLRVQQQHAAHELEEHKATFESKTKKMDAERQKLVGEKESLQQQLEQVKQACKTVRWSAAHWGAVVMVVFNNNNAEIEHRLSLPMDPGSISSESLREGLGKILENHCLSVPGSRD